MNDATQILLRMRDAGFALRAARDHRQHLNRIRLQKFIYLLDCLCILYDSVPVLRGHRTYKFGPYDDAIQNAVDVLAFRGLVRILKVRAEPDGSVASEYALTDAGQQWVDQIVEQPAFRPRWQAAADIALKVDARGWHRLRELSYAEPTYAVTRVQGLGRRLKTDDALDNSAASLLHALQRSVRHGFEGVTPGRELLLELFFRYLDFYARSVDTPASDAAGRGAL